MGLMNAISEWNSIRQERKIEMMREQGLCPECKGRGVHVPISDYQFSYMYYDCGGCEGSGKFTDWEKR